MEGSRKKVKASKFACGTGDQYFDGLLLRFVQTHQTPFNDPLEEEEKKRRHDLKSRPKSLYRRRAFKSSNEPIIKIRFANTNYSMNGYLPIASSQADSKPKHTRNEENNVRTDRLNSIFEWK